MNRVLFLSLVCSAAVVGYLFANPPVELQPITPGAVQTGNVNVSGKVLAGSVSATDAGSTAQVISGSATNASGANFGGLFKTSSSNGTGVRGVATSATGAANGGTFQTASPNGAGVRGYATAATGTSYGVYGKATGANAFAGFFDGRLQATNLLGSGAGLTNLNASALSSGTVADARLSANVPRLGANNTFSGTNQFTETTMFTGISLSSNSQAITFAGLSGAYIGIRDGVYANLLMGNGLGWLQFDVNGTVSVGAPGGPTYANGQRMIVDDSSEEKLATFRAQNGFSNTGMGIARRAILAQANGSGPSSGVYALASSSNSVSYGIETYATGVGANYALYANAGNGTSNWAGWFAGAIHATSATASIKAFLIDHPLDPENKYLEHSSVESDERMNLYRGTATTDAKGYATLRVPNWFTALNEDIQYQLTVIDEEDSDSFTQAKVVQQLRGDAFKIRTSIGGAKVNWMITGRRHDPTSNHYPLQVEREKGPGERGKYLVPEAYGKDQSHAMVQGSRQPERDRKVPAKGK